MGPAKDAAETVRAIVRHTAEGPGVDVPVIHLNGTGAETLVDSLCEAIEAVRFAQDKLRACNPNGRDYYPDPGRMPRAEALHVRRSHVLNELAAALEGDVEAIMGNFRWEPSTG